MKRINHLNNVAKVLICAFFVFATGPNAASGQKTNKRPLEGLYDLCNDMGCMDNLADDTAYSSIKEHLWERSAGILIKQKDPRMIGDGDFFDRCPVFKPMPLQDESGAPLFPGFAEYGEYNHGFNDGSK